MWLFWLALLLAVAFGRSLLAPNTGLRASAPRAFEASVSELSRGAGRIMVAAMKAMSPASSRTSPPEHHHCEARGQGRYPRSQRRHRSIARRSRRSGRGWSRRTMIFNAGFTNHIIPLYLARSGADFERLNSFGNLQPIHRIPCHQMKSSRGAASR